MRTAVFFVVAALGGGLLAAQEQKPVPKDSVRVFVPGCSKGYVFTAGRRTEDLPGGSGVPEGMHLRMSGPKKLMAEIKGHEGSRIEITGLMKKGQPGKASRWWRRARQPRLSPSAGNGGVPSPGGGRTSSTSVAQRPGRLSVQLTGGDAPHSAAGRPAGHAALDERHDAVPRITTTAASSTVERRTQEV